MSSFPAVRSAVPSPDGSLVATLQKSRLLVRSAATSEVIVSWPLAAEFVIKCNTIQWSRSSRDRTANEQRILLADQDSVRIYCTEDPNWQASVDNAAGNLGQLSNVVFGHSLSDILVFSDFGVKLTIWSLITRRGSEIRDPKSSVACFDIRSETGHLALLTRTTAQDTLLLLQPATFELLKSVELSTVDAQEVRWSRDGRWIAIRDIASVGHRVQIYTADGHLFRTFSGVQDPDQIELGVRCMEWTASGLLVIGDYNDNVTVLSKTTFNPLKTLHHTTPISLPGIEIWEEQLKAGMERSYALAAHPANPPSSSAITKSLPAKQGVSVMALNSDQTMLVTRSDAAPTTAWLWSMKTLKPITVLIHHSPIRHLNWHPQQPDLLLIHCAFQEPTVHFWKSNWDSPLAIKLPLERAAGRLESSWVQSNDAENFSVLLSSSVSSIVSRISAAGELVHVNNASHTKTEMMIDEAGVEDMFDEGNSLEFSPVRFEDTMGYGTLNDLGRSNLGTTEAIVDDTFHYRRQNQAIA
ncbi:uncharacterized protein KY384_006645 [Bacidia gigantensis]|uniref:uncharacterized protein n=1 Tax=Bacidia gigantensis TaxID=2732470 RepID=UPI001D0575DD|nr:uncharacterized protein KY384_006645 [Bacidia gigantensis]KAG8528956.1 hypothetical protein KY384_006645 [Bacidia gigantensis]